MLSLYHFIDCRPPLLPPPFSVSTRPKALLSEWLGRGCVIAKKRRCFPLFSSAASRCVAYASGKDSQFEVDPDKARDALKELDQQLESLSKKRVNPPKIRASEVNFSRKQATEEVPEPSGSALTFLAAALFLFTIFYNILFYTVIKPAIDGPDTVSTTAVMESAKIATLHQFPSAIDQC